MAKTKLAADLDAPYVVGGDFSSQAAREGHVAIDRAHFVRCWSPPSGDMASIVYSAALAIATVGVVAAFMTSVLGGLALLAAAFAVFLLGRYVQHRESRQHAEAWQTAASLGCLLPGVVVTLEPDAGLYAVYSDVGNRGGPPGVERHPMLRMRWTHLGQADPSLEVGDELPCVATYSDDPEWERRGSWGDFVAVPVVCYTRSEPTRQRCADRLPPECWENLRAALLCQGPIDPEVDEAVRFDPWLFGEAKSHLAELEASGKLPSLSDLLTDAAHHDGFLESVKQTESRS